MLGDPLQARTVRTNDVNVDDVQVLPSAVRERHRAGAIRREGHPLPVRRPRRTKVARRARGERLGSVRLQIHRPQVRRAAGAGRYEHELLAVWRERRLIVVRRIVREPLEAAAVRTGAVQIRLALAVRCEDDRRAVGRPHGVVVHTWRVQQRMLAGAVGRRHEQADLAGVREHPGKDDLLRRRRCRGQSGSRRDDDEHGSHAADLTAELASRVRF